MDAAPAAKTPARRSSRTALVAVVLAFAAGATDAFAFLQLSGVFTANMTGNLVLAGLVDRPGYSAAIAGIVTAVLVFGATLFVALRFMSGDAPTGRTVVLLVVAAVAQAAILGIWAVGPGGASSTSVVVLIGLSAMAMACQTAVAKRIDGASGVTTTYRITAQSNRHKIVVVERIREVKTHEN